MGRNVLQNHQKARLWARLVKRVGHAVIQSIKILAGLRGESKFFGNQIQNVLLALGLSQIGIQKVVAQNLGRLL